MVLVTEKFIINSFLPRKELLHNTIHTVHRDESPLPIVPDLAILPTDLCQKKGTANNFL